MHGSLGGGSSSWSSPLSIMQLMPYEQAMAGVIGVQGSCFAGIDIPPYEKVLGGEGDPNLTAAFAWNRAAIIWKLKE